MIDLDIFSSEAMLTSRVGTVRFSINNLFPVEFATNLAATFPNSLLAERLGDGLYSNINLNEDSQESMIFSDKIQIGTNTESSFAQNYLLITALHSYTMI